MLKFMILIIFGISLVAFIILERFRTEKPINRENGFEPGASGKETTLYILGAVGIVFGLYLFANPPHPPFTGHGSLISSILYAVFGPLGIPSFTMTFSIGVVVIYFVSKRRQLRQEREPNAG